MQDCFTCPLQWIQCHADRMNYACIYEADLEHLCFNRISTKFSETAKIQIGSKEILLNISTVSQIVVNI